MDRTTREQEGEQTMLSPLDFPEISFGGTPPIAAGNYKLKLISVEPGEKKKFQSEELEKCITL